MGNGVGDVYRDSDGDVRVRISETEAAVVYFTVGPDGETAVFKVSPKVEWGPERAGWSPVLVSAYEDWAGDKEAPEETGGDTTAEEPGDTEVGLRNLIETVKKTGGSVEVMGVRIERVNAYGRTEAEESAFQAQKNVEAKSVTVNEHPRRAEEPLGLGTMVYLPLRSFVRFGSNLERPWLDQRGMAHTWDEVCAPSIVIEGGQDATDH